MVMNIKQMETIANRARAIFLQYEGVLGVGYDYKYVKGKNSHQMAITVFVEKKLPPHDVKEGQLIPRTFMGFVTDVEEVKFNKEKDEKDGTELYEGRPMGEFLDWGKIHRLNIEQKKKQGHETKPKVKKGKSSKKNPPADLNTPVTEVREDLFVIDDDGTLVYTTTDGEDLVDLVGAWNLFRAEFADNYDFVAFFLDNTDANIPYMGNFSSTIYRGAAEGGYGVSAVNNRGSWGGTTSLLRYACHSWYSLRTMLHEIGHQWLFFVNYRNSPTGTTQTLLHEAWEPGWSAGQQSKHPGTWVDNDRSCMDYDHLDWIEVSPGVFRKTSISDVDFNFCPLDQYLMGFLHEEAVSSSRNTPPTYPGSGGDFQIINNPTLRSDGDYDATAVTITPENIAWEEGARTPDHLNSQRVFHQAVIAITSDRSSHATFLNDSETRRAEHAENWRRATNGRSVIDTCLLRDNIEDIYIRDNTSDTGGAFPGGVFWDSPDLFIRNGDDDPSLFLDPTVPNSSIHEKPKSNQNNWIYARIHNKGTTNYQNVRVNFYIANYHGFGGRDTVAEAVPRTEVIYPIDWHPESLIGSDTLTNVPAGGTAVAKVQWNQSDIPPSTWHPCLLAEIIPLGTAPKGLHHVWDNKKLAQKNLQIEYIPAFDYEFTIPFVISHAIDPSRFAFLEIIKEIDLPEVEILVDPGEVQTEIQQIGRTYFQRIPALAKKTGTTLKSPLVERKKEGIVISIPRDTTLGFECSSCEKSADDPIIVTFCDDSRVLIRTKKTNYGAMGLVPLEGFTVEQKGESSLLRMENIEKAKLPFPVIKGQEPEMRLKVRVDGAKLKKEGKLDIIQRNEKDRVVGGISVLLIPENKK
jgi:hypothetical protein